ncbi:TauD/TfdA family dioxygenase [Kitasatospora sp. MMS16-BH015]|uniref:TauD/TfdA family dioxygenase n=1 Tax=Kitasatospora sp. MMS16-BH015 TaxID=2018025 RepID=UPI00131A5BE9|nr:TauD/TfdA family dioxygenase [Kitasatospora sp. MMS16-BH015]
MAPDPAGVARADQLLRHGLGFALIRGLDLAGLTDADCLRAAHRLLAPLGAAHSLDGLLTAPPADHQEGRLGPHSDRGMRPAPPRLLALLCIRPAAEGGDSLLVSGHTVHDALLATAPEALAILYRPVHFGSEPPTAGAPAFDRHYPVFQPREGRLRMQYNRYWITRGQQEQDAPLTPTQLAALDAFDRATAAPGTTLRLRLRPGDLLVVDNLTVLHGRTAYTDPPPPAPGRCLARIWLD